MTDTLVGDTLARTKRLAAMIHAKRRLEVKFLQSQTHGGLLEFVRYYWPIVEPARPLIEGWPLEAICDHLEAVSRGEIKRLTISIPPGFMKSLIANVFFPAYHWGPMGNPEARFIAASYSQSLTVRDNVRFRNIITHELYSDFWSDVFGPSRDQFNIVKVANDRTGWKLATSVGGVGTGERGDFFVIDDGNSVKDAESDAVRESTNQWFTEVVPTRLNDADNGVIINIQQRTHESDITGIIMSRDLGYDMLRIPMEYETRYENNGQKRATSIGWVDPRTEDGELAWPERFSAEAVKNLKKVMGPYAVSGQFQQNPTPRGGGILKREWWQLWEAPKYPVCKYVWASADTAYTEKEENDPTGFTVWGLFELAGQPNIILMDAWRKRLELHIPQQWVDKDRSREARHKMVLGWQRAAVAQHAKTGGPDPVCSPDQEPWATFIETGQQNANRWPNESYDLWMYRTQEQWGLCEWLAHSCRKFKVNDLFIEGKASGLTVAQELRRLHGREGWGIHTVIPEGDKVARAYAIQSILSAGLVWAPDREWAELVIEESSVFPKGRYKDLTDSMTQALKHVREQGLLIRPEERSMIEDDLARYRPQQRALYPV